MDEEIQTHEQAAQVWADVEKERAAEQSPPSAEYTTAATEPVEKVEPEAAAEPEKKPAETAAKGAEKPDPFAGLSPEVRTRLERFDALEQQARHIPQLVQSVRTAEGRVAAMQRELDVAKAAAKAVGDAPSKAQIAAAAASTEKWSTLKSDFPEWADATEEYVKASLAGITPQQISTHDPEEVKQLLEKVEATRKETLKAIEEAKVESKHDDWLDVIRSDDFGKWHRAQTPEIQKLAMSPKGRDAIRMIDLFKQAREKPAEVVQQARQNKLAAAVTTKPGAPAAVTKTVAQMSPKELWDYEARAAAKRRSASGLAY